MKDIYSGVHSDYLKRNKTWGLEDAAWKAAQIFYMLQKHPIHPKRIVEVGCGTGEILVQLQHKLGRNDISYEGYDIAEDAINIGRRKVVKHVNLYHKDFLSHDASDYDLLLMIDVFEHVPDYIGFVEKCSSRATYKIYHIPLDIHVSSLLRNKMIHARNKVGHLHYFTKETALETLRDTGQEIIDYCYTPGAEGTAHKKFRTRLANLPRKIMFSLFPDLTVKLIGGYSLLVLAK